MPLTPTETTLRSECTLTIYFWGTYCLLVCWEILHVCNATQAIRSLHSIQYRTVSNYNLFLICELNIKAQILICGPSSQTDAPRKIAH